MKKYNAIDELPRIISEKWIYWDGTSETIKYELEHFVRAADGKCIVVYTDKSKMLSLAFCEGESFEDCKEEMKRNLSEMKFIDGNTLESKKFDRPLLSKSYCV